MVSFSKIFNNKLLEYKNLKHIEFQIYNITIKLLININIYY